MIDSATKRPLYRRIWFWFVIATAAPVIWIIVDWKITDSGVKRTIAELRSQGMPTAASELNDYYRVPEGAADTTEVWVKAIDSTNVLVNDEEAKSLPFVGISRIPVTPPGEPWEQLEASREFLSRLAPQMEAIRNAASHAGVARLPVDFSDGVLTDFGYVFGVRRIAGLLQLHAHVNNYDRQHDEVLSDILDIFAVADAMEVTPCLIPQLSRSAIHRIGCDMGFEFASDCPWSEADLARIADAASTADFRAGMKTALCGERAGIQELIADASIPGFVQSNKRRTLELFGAVIDGLDADWPDALATADETMDKLEMLKKSRWSQLVASPIVLLTLSFDKAVRAAANATARQRCFIVSIAIRRYMLREGRLPQSLSDLTTLVPGRDQLNFIDPFNGQALNFVTNEEGVLIYSVGDNLVDDGGSIVNRHKFERPPLDVGLLIPKTR